MLSDNIWTFTCLHKATFESLSSISPVLPRFIPYLLVVSVHVLSRQLEKDYSKKKKKPSKKIDLIPSKFLLLLVA